MLLEGDLEVEAMEEAVSFRIAYFGPPTEGLLEKVNDEA